MTSDWWSLAQTAEYHGVSGRTVRNWVAAGRLPAYRVGSRLLRFRRDDVEGLARRVPAAGA